MNWWTQNGFVDPVGSNIDELREADSWGETENEAEDEEDSEQSS